MQFEEAQSGCGGGVRIIIIPEMVIIGTYFTYEFISQLLFGITLQ